MASIDEVNDIAPIDQYMASASQTGFDYSFPITAEADLVVYDNDTLQVLTTDYTVTGVGADTGGTITFVVGRTAGHIITIYRDIAIDRISDFQQNGPISSVTFNDELDKITLILQQLERDGARAVRMSLRNAQASADLELDSAFEGKYLFVNSDGELEPAAAVATTTLTQSIIGGLLYPQTAAEAAVGVVPVNHAYPPGHVYRYGTNAVPGTTDMTTPINNAATVCRQGKYTLRLPEETCFVSSTLDFNLIRVEGPTADMAGQIQASSAQFNVISVKESASFANFRVNGGWDGSTAGQTGDIFHIENTGGSGFAYNIHLHNITAQNAKQRLLYWKHAGYGSIYNFHGNAAGLHGFELFGTNAANQATTIAIGGHSIFSDTPNGFGVKLTQCVAIHFNDVIMENTQGIQLNGADNRALTFENVYQENTIGGAFITDNGSAGIGLTIKNCFGGNHTVPYLTNWENVYFQGNSNLSESAVPLTGRIVQHDGGELTTVTTGGVSVTAAQVSLSPGTWMIDATLQTADGGAAAVSDVACVITTDVAHVGASSSTSTFETGAARASYATVIDRRLNCKKLYQNTTAASVIVYLRSRLTLSAGTLAYRGFLNAVRLQ